MAHQQQTDAHMRRIYQALTGGVLILDADGRIEDANAAAEDLLGVSVSQMRGRVHAQMFTQATCADGTPLPPGERPAMVALRTGRPVCGLAVRLPHADGTTRHVQVDAVPVCDETGAVTHVVVSYVDLTARLQAEEARRASEDRYRRLVETAQEGIWELDPTLSTTYVNPKMATLLGYPAEEMLGRPFWAFMDAKGQALARATMERYPDGHAEPYEYKFVRSDGAELWALLTTPRLYDGAGQCIGACAMVTDITARKYAEQRLVHVAHHDALTGLPNRALLQERLGQAIAQAQRNGTALALFLMDLDHFKEVNDTLGHDAGDVLLQEVARRMQEIVRTSDTVARLGGDEFAVVLPGATEDGGVQVARKILSAIAAPITLRGEAVVAEGSIGIAMFPPHGTDAATLLRHADVAMYAAKRSGGGHTLYTSEADQHTASRLARINALHRAISDGELRLHYQPMVDADTGHVRIVEALVRWHHPEQGLLAPDHFIPLAEQSGLVLPLTRWVLETAVRQVRAWQDEGLDLAVAVNLSARVLRDTELPQTIAAILAEHAVQASKLRVELTESMVMADPTTALEVLTRLAQLGVRIAIDDFGTGQSSLAYLKRLPVDEIKIDRSFVTNMTGDAHDATIVASTIGLGHSLGLRFVAEGVETREAWQALASLGCDTVQGFYFSRALPADDLTDWVRGRSWAAA